MPIIFHAIAQAAIVASAGAPATQGVIAYPPAFFAAARRPTPRR